MANHALPTTTDLYANVLTYLHGRIDDASKWYDSALTYTNPPTGVVQWDSTAFTWKKNTGTAGSPVWSAHSAYYNININGTIGATTPNSATFSTITVNTSAALPITATMGGSTLANLGSTTQTFTGSVIFSNASPIVSAKIGPTIAQQHVLPAVASDTIALIAASQTFTNKTYSAGALSGTFSGNHILSGQVSFNEATAPIITAKLGPNTSQQHTLPAIASDTFVLLSATQTLTNKTLSGASLTGSAFNGTIGATTPTTGVFSTIVSNTGYIQSPGYSSSYGVTNGISTGAINAVMGTGASATWLLSGSSGGIFRYGIQGLDAGGAIRFYNGSSWLGFDGTNLTNSVGSTFVTSANYNSYAPTLTGTGASGTWGINITGNVSSASDTGVAIQQNGNAATWYGRVVTKNSTNDKSAFLGTYGSVSGVFAHNNALSAWADLYVNTLDGTTGGSVRLPSSTFINGSQSIHAGNYNSYAPTLTGTGASGSWGISITGNAATATNGLTTSNYNSYAPTLTGTGASGTWGINITGNAGTATQLSSTQQTNIITGKTQSMAMTISTPISDGSFICRATGTGDSNLAGINFHNDVYAIKMGIRADGYFGLGGWSRAAWSWYSAPNGDMVAAGNVSAYSDPRLKQDFERIKNPLELLNTLDGGTFIWREGFPHTQIKAGKKDYGILADQVEAIMPEIVTESVEIDGKSYKTVSYEKLVPVLIEAIKLLNNKVKKLESLK